MPANSTGKVINFRWGVFLLALGFWFYQFTQTSFDSFGWQFRFLTIWGLSAALVTSWLMLRYSLGQSERTYNPLVSAVVVLEIIVVFMYWKLWFTDPALVNSNGPIVWYQEYYLHALGPALMLFDAFFILGAFRQIVPTFLAMMVIFLAYIGWVEFLVGPLNMYPEGSVANGLPYPFLNNMERNARLVFYVTTIGTAIVMMFISWSIAIALKRIKRD